MKRLLILVPLVFFRLTLVAQDYTVVGMEALPVNLLTQNDVKTDEYGRQCALFCIVTENIPSYQLEKFYFSCDYASFVAEKVLNGNEILLWVSPGIKTLKIMHNTMGQWDLHISNYQLKVESLHTYKILIKGLVEQMPTSPQTENDEQFLQFLVTPANAEIYVDDELWPSKDGAAKKTMKLGTHHYRVAAPYYYSTGGEATLDAPGFTKVINVDLKPAFGFLKIDNTDADLSDASVFLDSDPNAIPYTDTLALQVGSGLHRVSIQKPHTSPYTRTVEIFDGQTKVLRPLAKTNFVTADFAYCNEPQTSFGLTIGSVKKAGWFISAASNFNFKPLNCTMVGDDGLLLVNNSYFYPDYTGETASTRISVMAGMLYKVHRLVFLKLGAGYGCRVKCWYTSEGRLVGVASDCYGYNNGLELGIDATMGAQLNLKGFTVSLDAVAGFNKEIKMKTTEVKICLGYNWIKLF